MKIASVLSKSPGANDRLLTEVATRLRDEGVRICGAVQTNVESSQECRCAMDLVVLPTGQTIRISQDLGSNALGCRLDAGALEQAVFHVETALSEQVDLLIINKFGKRESEGRGFRVVIADALEHGIPVLVGISESTAADFRRFVGELAEELPGDADVLLDWCRTHVPTNQA